MWGAILPAIGSVIGAGIEAAGASSAQDAANKAAAEEAQRNREFQERMSSTSVRRYADDLAAAGFNRILAAGGGQASSPAGSVAPVGAVNTAAGIGRGLSSAMSAAQTVTEMGAKQAAAVQSLNAAEASLASAKNAEADRPRIEAEAKIASKLAGARVTEAEAKAARSAYDRKYMELDSNIDRGSKLIGAGSDLVGIASGASSIKHLLQRTKNLKTDRTMNIERHLKNQGAAGTSILK